MHCVYVTAWVKCDLMYVLFLPADKIKMSLRNSMQITWFPCVYLWYARTVWIPSWCTQFSALKLQIAKISFLSTYFCIYLSASKIIQWNHMYAHETCLTTFHSSCSLIHITYITYIFDVFVSLFTVAMEQFDSWYK